MLGSPGPEVLISLALWCPWSWQTDQFLMKIIGSKGILFRKTMLTKFLDLFSVGKLVVANWSSDLKLFIFATKKSSVESAKDSKLSSFQQPWGSDGREPLQSWDSRRGWRSPWDSGGPTGPWKIVGSKHVFWTSDSRNQSKICQGWTTYLLR